MPLFLSISGFVFKRAYFDEVGYVKRNKRNRQIVNFLPNYIVFSLIWGLAKIILGQLVNQGTSITDILLMWCKPIDQYWYLYDLIIFYLFFSNKKIRRVPGNIMVGVLVLASCISGFISVAWLDISRLCFNAFFFFLGMNFMPILRQMDERRVIPVVGICITAALFIVFWNGGPYIEQAKALC